MSPPTALRRRYAFAGAFLGSFVVAELVYGRLGPAAQARLVAWASTNVANLEHEPVLPLLVSPFLAPRCSPRPRPPPSSWPASAGRRAKVAKAGERTPGERAAAQPPTWPTPTAMPIR